MLSHPHDGQKRVDAALAAVEARIERLTTDEDRLVMLQDFHGYGETACEQHPHSLVNALDSAMSNLADNTWDMRGEYSTVDIVAHVESILHGDR